MSNITLEEIGQRAKAAEAALRVLPTGQKNKALQTAADYLMANMKMILEANAADVEQAKENQMSPEIGRASCRERVSA